MELQKFTSSLVLFSSLLHYFTLLYYLSLFHPTTSTTAHALGNETDRIALLNFKESISNDPHGVLSSWNDSLYFCNWHGISCGKGHQRIIALDLEGYSLRGTISPSVGNLSFLRFINLRNNSFYGDIPQQFDRLSRLRYLNLYSNMLEGKIPVNLSHCSHLQVLVLGRNRLVGTIPWEIGSLVRLFYLDVENNNLTGGIPPSVGNISSLREFYVLDNNMAGTIPEELGRLKSLTVFTIGPNNFSGTIPLSLYNISTMSSFAVLDNRFKGTLPPTIGRTLPNLVQLFMGGNEFSGIIPDSLSNMSRLQQIDLGSNDFVGGVPHSLGNLPDLWGLLLQKNHLGNYSTNSLDFVTSLTNCSHLKILDLSVNMFGGVLPNSIANLSTKLTQLYMGRNQISGNIPATLENFVNLILLGLDKNLFTGVIPTSLGKLQRLQIFSFDTNRLSGKIPSSIGNLTQLFEVYLLGNKLEGSIPPNIVNCQNLQLIELSDNSLSGEIPKEIFYLFSLSLLNLSRNSLTGSLPLEVGKLININTLDLSNNNLNGELPESIGDCESLEFLYLQGNFFRGSLPSTLAFLRGLQYLDLSQNHLSGQIPKDLQKLRSLWNLNLSFNDLEGEVPNEGIFRNASAISKVGNTKLCGSVSKLQLQACPIKESRQGKASHLRLTIIIVGVATVFLLFSGLIIFYWRWKSARKSSHTLSTVGSLSKVSYKRLYDATNGFSTSMLIGTGNFGSVYKGIFDEDENLVAIKVLNLQQKGADKSFLAECNALRNIRHRNLVKVLTCCSSIDYNGNEFKALVFEFMSSGSLEKWLHLVTVGENRPGSLNIVQRLSIANDIASAIHYLHDDSGQPVIHCDLKPSNVLLDREMVAHISDFGLARLILNTTSSDGQTSTAGIKGTIGYVAPEYAMGGEPSKQADVYSYGILVLEMFTGRRPTDEMFKDDFNLHNFVKMALPERLVQIVDPVLLPREVEEISTRGEDRRNYNNNNGDTIEIGLEEGNGNLEISAHLQNCLVKVLEIGVACSKESPNERISMVDVVRELQQIRNAYVSVGIQRQTRRTS